MFLLLPMCTFNGIAIVNGRPTVLRVKRAWAASIGDGESLHDPVAVLVDQKMKDGVCRHPEVPGFGLKQITG